MALLLRLSKNILQKNTISTTINRCLNTTLPLKLKEIQINQEKDILTITGVTVPSPREQFLVTPITSVDDAKPKCCTICDLELDVKHTDVLILSQYLRSDGCMLPRRITGLCRTQQRRIGTMVTMAQKAGLMSNLNPSNSKKDPKKRFQWKKYNKYYDETTIKC